MDNKTNIAKGNPIIIGFLFLLVWFAASFFNGRFTWGFDSLQYHPLWFRLAWFMAGAAALLSFGLWIPGILKINDRFAVRKPWGLVLLIAVMGGLFLMLRQAIPLLGDGFLRVREITGGRIFSLTEPLTTMIHGAVYKTVSGSSVDLPAARWIYASVSIASGLTVVWLYHKIVTCWAGQNHRPAMALMLGLGLNQIFFGYVESYAPFMLAVLAFSWLAVLSFDEKKYIIPAVLLFSVAASLHAKGVFLLPALSYLLIINRPDIKGKYPALIFSLITVPALALIIAWVFSPPSHWAISLKEIPQNPLLPLWRGMWGYGILSPGHWLDVLNQYLLTIPGIIFIFLALLAGRIRGRPDRAVIFLSILAVSGLAFILVTDPKLGAARDWDLFAWAGIPAAMLGLLLLKQNQINKKILMIGGFLSLWLFLPWVLLNASPTLSVNRYLELLNRDRRSAAYGYESLAIHYRSIKQDDKVEWVYKKAVESEPNSPRMLYNYGSILARNGKTAQAAEFYGRALEMDPSMAEGWNNYGSELLKLGQYQKAREAAERSVFIDESNSDAWYNLGIICSILQDWAKADTAFSRASEGRRNNVWLAAYWGEVQLHLGQYRNAAANLETAIRFGVKDSITIDGYNRAAAAVERMGK